MKRFIIPLFILGLAHGWLHGQYALKNNPTAASVIESRQFFMQQAYSGTPSPAGIYVSSNGNIKGPWNPLMFGASGQAYSGTPGPIGLYYSSNGTIKGPWYPCTVAVCFSGGTGGVTQLVAGTNISLSPVGGTGVVTITASSTAATAFSALTGSTNSTATMIVGTGATLSTSGSGSITATAAPLSGISGLGTGVGTFLGTPSSANLAAAITDETGTGLAVFATSPTLTTAVLGSSTATTQSAKDNSTKLATTAYVDRQTPLTTGTSVTLTVPRQYFPYAHQHARSLFLFRRRGMSSA